MASEEEMEAHTIWGGIAARWYNLASNRHPAIGRFYHHFGILERPSLRKKFLDAKSLIYAASFLFQTIGTPLLLHAGRSRKRSQSVLNFALLRRSTQINLPTSPTIFFDHSSPRKRRDFLMDS
jgi:hypothetical protein